MLSLALFRRRFIVEAAHRGAPHSTVYQRKSGMGLPMAYADDHARRVTQHP